MGRMATLGLLGALLAGVPPAAASAEPAGGDVFGVRLAAAALERTRHAVVYDGSYQRLDYPGGDVAPDRGVCTDVVIRAYRALGIDLQRRVHESMRAEFDRYPTKWGLTRPDRNIDHRRVPNLRTFFRLKGRALVPGHDAAAFRPGDLVTWDLGGDLPHIGIVANARSADGGRPLIVHNIGAGPKLEDVLFDYTLTGHYRYTGE